MYKTISVKFNMFVSILILTLLTSFQTAFAEERELLYATELSDDLKQVVAKLQDSKQKSIPYKKLNTKPQYFVRIAPRKYILTAENQVQDGAILGTKPFVFVATPEGIYGKSLLDIYLDIGYEAEDIIRWQRDVDMVVIVFRYAEDVTLSDVKTGELPDTWAKHIFSPTWDNMFTLFENLTANAAINPEQKGEFMPTALSFRSETLKNFVLNFPQIGKDRVKNTAYQTLQTVGGSDGLYRDLLEKKLSLFEHFRGNGRTLNEIIDPHGTKRASGILEFVGPNSKVNALPEVAIIHLGKLTMEDVYKK